jgi:hypothetical protein
MPAPTFPTTKIEFVQALNGNAYNAATNPYGMASGGHRQNWPTAMNYMGDIGTYMGAVADYVAGVVEQVAEDAASAAAGSGTESTVANLRTGTSAQYVSIRRVYGAGEFVALTDAASIVWDMAAGINFVCTLGAAGRALANPTNQVAGKIGIILIKQDATGGRSITDWGNNFVWIGGKPDWPTTPNARSIISYMVEASGTILLNYGGSSL